MVDEDYGGQKYPSKLRPELQTKIKKGLEQRQFWLLVQTGVVLTLSAFITAVIVTLSIQYLK